MRLPRRAGGPALPMPFHRFGDLDLQGDLRERALCALLSGGNAELPGDALPTMERARALAAELGRRFPERHPFLARVLATAPILEAAMLRLLDTPPAAATEHLLRDEATATRFCVFAGGSSVYGRLLSREPALLHSAAGEVARADRELAELGEGPSPPVGSEERQRVEASAIRLLRRRRAVSMLGVIEAELCQTRTVIETAGDIARIADCAVRDAMRIAERLLDAGDLRLVCFALGKHGSEELNLCSDIDPIFVYEPRDPSDRDAERSAQLVRLVTRLLDEPSELGPVFRVDLRLRPFGSQGALAHTPAQMLAYYETHGRTWERSAWIRARAVAGDESVAVRTTRLLRPFIWRRHLDPAAIAEIAEMKRKVDADQRARHAGRSAAVVDVKLGRGGIREVEFFAQSFQLVWGGREPDLQVRPTVLALRRLAARGLLPEVDLWRLIAAYQFLRTTEHRLQMDEERQTQVLPQTSAEQARFAWRMGFSRWESFLKVLDGHRRRVSQVFGRLFEKDAERSQAPGWVAALVAAGPREDAAEGYLRELGFRRPDRVQRDLLRLSRPPEPVIGPHAEPGVGRAAEQLIELTTSTGLPDRAFDRVVEMLGTRRTRGAVLRIVEGNPRAATVLAALFSASEELGRIIVRNPDFVDTLLSDQASPVLDLVALRDRLSMQLTMRPRFAEMSSREANLVVARRFRNVEMARVALAIFGGRLTMEEGTRALTDVAEVCLERMRSEAIDELRDRLPSGVAGRFGAVGFGKLGSREMGFHSDLDVVFVYDDDPSEVAAYARLAQRWVSYMTAPTAHGRLYSVDMRLRPDGGQGAAVTTVDGFARYYAERAWPWEKLALLRARPVAMERRLQARIDALIEAELDRVDPDAVRSEIGTLRARRIEALVARGGALDVKWIPGGLADVELLLQYHEIVARRAGKWKGLREGNGWGLIARLRKIESIGIGEAKVLSDAIELFRRVEVWARLSEGSESSALPADPERLRALAMRVLGEADADGDGLLRAIRSAAGRVNEFVEKRGLHAV